MNIPSMYNIREKTLKYLPMLAKIMRIEEKNRKSLKCMQNESDMNCYLPREVANMTSGISLLNRRFFKFSLKLVTITISLSFHPFSFNLFYWSRRKKENESLPCLPKCGNFMDSHFSSTRIFFSVFNSV